MRVLIADIQRMSTEDGPGLRTTVFFKGCNLKCTWCHNPETISSSADINWYKNKCIGCGICVGVCPKKGIKKSADGIGFRRELCIGCRACEDNCPNAAIELKGRTYEVDALFCELIKDKAYFGTDGGVTLSGGEVMLQQEAAFELAARLKSAGVGVALDTAGLYESKRLKRILPLVDVVLYDLKLIDPVAHAAMTGADNKLILENYKLLSEAGARVWVRTPIVEDSTDSELNIEGIAKFLAENGLPEKWELCAFNNLCRDKYLRLDLDWQHKEAGLIKKEKMERLLTLAKGYVKSAEYSGAVAE